MTLFRGILIFVGALIFSVLLWAYVRLSSAYEADVDLPIKLIAPKGFALASGLPERLHTRVRGAGWQIMLMNFTKNANFNFDLSERALSPEALVTLHSDEITNAAILPSELRVLKVDPDSLQLQFGKAIEKRIAISPRLGVTPSRGYMIAGEPQVTPRYVIVVGAANILDSLTQIPTQTIAVGDAREDVDRTINIGDSLENFITVKNVQKIAVHVDVQAIGERKIVGVPVTIEALPPQYDLIFIPGMVNITLRGGVDDIAKLPMSSVHARVVYDPMVFDTARVISPKVDVPKGMTFLFSDPANLRFIVRRKTNTPSNAKAGTGGGNAAQ
jgi:hypothetical protein